MHASVRSTIFAAACVCPAVLLPAQADTSTAARAASQNVPPFASYDVLSITIEYLDEFDDVIDDGAKRCASSETDAAGSQSLNLTPNNFAGLTRRVPR